MPESVVNWIMYHLVFRLFRRDLYMSEDRNTIVISTATSMDAVRIVQDLFDRRSRVSPWTGSPLKLVKATVDGSRRTLTITGQRGYDLQHEFTLTVENASAGFPCSGTLDTAAILSRFGFGDYEALYERISSPPVDNPRLTEWDNRYCILFSNPVMNDVCEKAKEV